jgi:hypothetical protein
MYFVNVWCTVSRWKYNKTIFDQNVLVYPSSDWNGSAPSRIAPQWVTKFMNELMSRFPNAIHKTNVHCMKIVLPILQPTSWTTHHREKNSRKERLYFRGKNSLQTRKTGSFLQNWHGLGNSQREGLADREQKSQETWVHPEMCTRPSAHTAQLPSMSSETLPKKLFKAEFQDGSPDCPVIWCAHTTS